MSTTTMEYFPQRFGFCLCKVVTVKCDSIFCKGSDMFLYEIVKIVE